MSRPPSSGTSQTAVSAEIQELYSEQDKTEDLNATSDLEKQEEAAKAESSQPQAPEVDPYLVGFDGPHDPSNPLNWKAWYRWMLVGISGFMLLNTTFASSAPSGITQDMMNRFGMGEEVATLTISIFVCGYIAGPIIWGPLSERIGRRKTSIISTIPYLGFLIGCALSKNTGSILTFRFLAGLFGAAPQSVSAAVVADVTHPRERAFAFSIFALGPYLGPSLAPLVSGWISTSGASFRWMYWTLVIFTGVTTPIVLWYPETYALYILKQKAQRLRKETGDNRYYSVLEKRLSGIPRSRLAYDLLVSPFKMLVEEPMLFLVSLYLAFAYGILYLMFVSIPFIFVRDHGFNLGELGLTYISIPLGGVLSCLMTIFYFNKRYVRKMKAAAPKPLEPEVRLEVVMFAAPIFAAAFIIQAWTSFSYLPWAGPIVAMVMIGFSSVKIMLGLMNFTVEVYLPKAATALSGQTMMRSVFGASFPLFGRQMYERLGVAWAGTLLFFLATAMIPIPFLFYRYGKRLRALSKNAYPSRPDQ